MSELWILFHRIAESDSARVRKAIIDEDLKEKIDFRNVGSGTRDIALLTQMDPQARTPALLLPNGSLVSGGEDVLAKLQELKKSKI